MSVETAVEQVGRRVELHREAHRAWRRVALGLLMLSLVLAGVIVVLVLRERPMDRAYAATPDGRVIPMTPLEEPVMTQAALSAWVVTAVTEAFTLGHHDFRLRLSAVREYFTEQGYDGYTVQLEKSRLLERVREYRQVTSAVAKGRAGPHEGDDLAGTGALDDGVPDARDVPCGKSRGNDRISRDVACDAGEARGAPGRDWYSTDRHGEALVIGSRRGRGSGARRLSWPVMGGVLLGVVAWPCGAQEGVRTPGAPGEEAVRPGPREPIDELWEEFTLPGPGGWEGGS